jgi:UDP-glucuronate 4-epimerase
LIVKILVTGNAGFIGFYTAKALIERGDKVVGIDSVNSYYDSNLKESRLRQLEETARGRSGAYQFIRANLADNDVVRRCFAEHRFDRVIHLAAQPGVRHSLVDPQSYVESNLAAFTNVLEGCRHAATPHLTYASSSSVYGANATVPYSEQQGADHPLQFYAATKRANELMAHAYSHLFRLPSTGLRFFTVYGPWGRPDMAYFSFTRNILTGQPIKVFSHGRHSRDFTFIDDIVDGVIRASDHVAAADPNWDAHVPGPAGSNAPYRIFNVGNGHPASLDEFIAAIEAATGVQARRELVDQLPGDMENTYADVSLIARETGYRPRTGLKEGISAFVAWYRSYYGC